MNKKLVSLENNLNVSIRDSANARISKKVVVYTAIFGDYDDLIDQILVSKNFDFIDFSDNKSIADKSKIWQFNEVDSSIFPRESMSRINKTDF